MRPLQQHSAQVAAVFTASTTCICCKKVCTSTTSPACQPAMHTVPARSGILAVHSLDTLACISACCHDRCPAQSLQRCLGYCSFALPEVLAPVWYTTECTCNLILRCIDNKSTRLSFCAAWCQCRVKRTSHMTRKGKRRLHLRAAHVHHTCTTDAVQAS